MNKGKVRTPSLFNTPFGYAFNGDFRINDCCHTNLLITCIKVNHDNFGHFFCYFCQLTAVVTNDLAITNVTWEITVQNVNDPPVFSLPVYNRSIQEFTIDNSALVTVTVTDPDDSTPEVGFHFDRVEDNCEFTSIRTVLSIFKSSFI